MISYVVQQHIIGGEDSDYGSSKVIAVFSSEAEARSFVLTNENLRECTVLWRMIGNVDIVYFDVTRFEGTSSQTVAAWFVQ